MILQNYDIRDLRPLIYTPFLAKYGSKQYIRKNSLEEAQPRMSIAYNGLKDTDAHSQHVNTSEKDESEATEATEAKIGQIQGAVQ